MFFSYSTRPLRIVLGKVGKLYYTVHRLVLLIPGPGGGSGEATQYHHGYQSYQGHAVVPEYKPQSL